MQVVLSVHQTEDIYGDGLNYAAMAIIFLLDEHNAFNFLDFSYHLLNIYNNDSTILQEQFKMMGKDLEDAKNETKKLEFIIRRIGRIKRLKFSEQLKQNAFYFSLNNNIFQLFQSFGEKDKKIIEFDPPKFSS